MRRPGAKLKLMENSHKRGLIVKLKTIEDYIINNQST